MASSFAVVGTNPLAQEIFELCREAGCAVERAEPGAFSVPPAMVVETSAAEEPQKRAILSALARAVAPECVIVTSCLRFSPTELASWTTRPERVVGFATFYPIRERKLIELSGGLRTEERALQAAENFFSTLKKATVRVREGAGLVFPRVLSLIVNEAARALSEGIAAAEEIDVAMRLGVNYPRGPLEWADQAGLDEVLAVLEGLQRETGDDRYRPAALLKRMVQAGYLGERTKRGLRVKLEQ
ncbi:MAG TPA: 3-hydroxyacyl-CoA dehydrogenase family protein [Candidatus Acidoferrales bacterium]|nr:3-hydroxyacyl-CoA dehydrogenase family protein [Candidatus Acidoferrales bacterium]